MIVLDDVGMRALTPTETQGLCEIFEERSIGNSTVSTSQQPLEYWSDVIADAIHDRLQRAALTITITGESNGGANARKLAGSSKDS